MSAVNKYDLLKARLRKGAIIRADRCPGVSKEFRFTGWEGNWICGVPTPSHMRDEGLKGDPMQHQVFDISPNNLTHINGVAV